MDRTYYPIDDSAARIAHEMNSFREFRSDEPNYRAAVDEVWAAADGVAKEHPEFAYDAYALADRFAERYAAWINEGYRIESMCPSVMVSGGANFPTRKKERQNRARDRHMEQRERVMSIRDRLARLGTGGIRSGDPQALAKLEAKLRLLEARQDSMKRANAHWRRNGTLEGFECDDAELMGHALDNIGTFGGAPFPPYALSNNNANIKRTRSRLEQLSREKEAPASERAAEVGGEPCLVIENTEAMRLQIVFEDKPDPETRELLKRSGFRWSPRNGAWQRQLTDNARRALQAIEG